MSDRRLVLVLLATMNVLALASCVFELAEAGVGAESVGFEAAEAAAFCNIPRS